MRTLVISLIAAATLFAGQSRADEQELVYKILEQQITARAGSSILTFNPLNNLLMPTAHRLRVRVTQGCAISVPQLELHYDGSLRGVVHAVDRQGFVNQVSPGIAGVSLHLYNPRWLAQTCYVLLEGYSYVKGEEEEEEEEERGFNLEDFILAANLPYRGGFRANEPSPIAPAYPITHVWLRVPQFCQQVEILELSWADETGSTRAKLVDRDNRVYELDRSGVRINELRISINGPTGTSCDIPIYINPAQ